MKLGHLALSTLAAAALLSGCATPIQPPIVGYTCCNLRPVDGWVSSHNVQGGALLPAGEPVKLDAIKKRYYVYGTAGGTDIGLRDDNAKNEADTLAWVRTIVVSGDPRAKLATWPAEIRTAVQTAKVMVGMSREQVLMSLGYPAKADTPDLASPTWRYWTALDDTTVDLHFDEAGRLIKVSGTPTGVGLVSFPQ
jgi:hypothetical protein